MADENKGQEGGTLTAAELETKQLGQELDTGSPTGIGGETDTIIALAEAAEKEASAASTAEEKIAAAAKVNLEPEKEVEAKPKEKAAEKKTEEKTIPYDQDPKWKSARAAEKNLNSILEKHGYDSFEDLQGAIDDGATLTGLLGKRDLNKLIKDADYLTEVKSYWAEQEHIKEEEGLDPEELADKRGKETEAAKRELKDYKQTQSDKEAKTKEEKANDKAVSDYGKAVEQEIEDAGFKDESAEIAKLFLGVDNPFASVDIMDKKAVKEVAKGNISKLNTFLGKVRQDAVDKYAKGKSEIVPITSTESTTKETKKETKIPDDVVVDQNYVMNQFQDLTNEILEMAEKEAAS